jgi:hypothetical protein
VDTLDGARSTTALSAPQKKLIEEEAMNKANYIHILEAKATGAKDTERPLITLTETRTGDVIDDQEIWCGYVPLKIEKMFGPLIFAAIRIHADPETCEWVIERQRIDTTEWIVVAKIPGQIPEEFKEEP